MQSATQLQATAEDLFVSMCEIDYETGEQYIVDEGSKLLMMCSQLLFQDLKEGTYENIRRLRNFLKRRPNAGMGDRYSFDGFVEVYNFYVMEGFKLAAPGWRDSPVRSAPASPAIHPSDIAVARFEWEDSKKLSPQQRLASNKVIGGT